MATRFRTLVMVVVLLTAGLVTAGPASGGQMGDGPATHLGTHIDTDSSIGTAPAAPDDDGVGQESDIPSGPDTASIAAENNQLADMAATESAAATKESGPPLVPQRAPERLGLADDNISGLLSDTAPDANSGLLVPMSGINGTSCNFETLDAAIAAAPAGSTIFVKPGTYPAPTANVNYNIATNLDIVQGTASCQATATPQNATNVVLQLAAGSTLDAVLEVYNGATVRLERITVQGGNSSEGTVFVFGESTTLTLDGSIVRNGNNPSTTVGGGGLRVDSATVTSLNNSQIENNTAVLGGGVYVNGGTFSVVDIDNVELNDATVGGGVYATGDAVVILTNDADVLSNDATVDGGGVYLTGGADLAVTGSLTSVGLGGEGNSANRGGGVFVDDVAGTTVTLGGGAFIDGNDAVYGAGIYQLGGKVTVNDGGTVSDNTGGNGGGILATLGAVVDLNKGAAILRNSGGLGAGVFLSGSSTLTANGGSGGGVIKPVVFEDNASTSDGGGLNVGSQASAMLDTVHFHGNSAVDGGGVYVAGDADLGETSGCGAGVLEFEEYCNEFRGNSASYGGAAYVNGGVFDTDRTAFIANTATVGAQAIQAVSVADVDLTASMVLGHDATGSGDGTITGGDTANIVVKAATVIGTGAWFDNDGSATSVFRRVIADTDVLTPGSSSGSCNLQVPGGHDLPGAIKANPRFVTTAHSAYVPDAASPATDACKAFGVPQDIFGFGVKDGDGVGSGHEYDIGTIEADTGVGFSCDGKAASIVGSSGADVLSGTSGADVIVSLGGADTIAAKGGPDTICAGGGSDTVDAGGGKDTIFGSSGGDTLLGGGGKDSVFGGSGSDKLRGGSGADRLEGAGGGDNLKGQGGVDALFGGRGKDTLNGGKGAPDVCNGGAGKDASTGGCEKKKSIP